MIDPKLPTLSERDRERLAAIEVLARGESAVPSLVALLDEPSWPVRRAVVAALGRIGESAVGPLVSSLVADRADERRIAATVDALVAVEADADARLIQLGGEAPAVICDAAQVLGRRRSLAGVPALTEWSRHGDDNVAVCALEALGRIGGGAGLEAVTAAAGSGSFFRMFAALEVLARTDDPRALAPLQALLDDPMAGLEATRALGRRGQPDAVRALAALLDSRNESRLRAAASGLVAVAAREAERYGTSESVHLGVRAAVSDLPATARRIARATADGDPDERAALARVLGWLGDPSGAESLIGLLTDEPRVMRAASEALAALGGAGTHDLLAALVAGDSERRAILLPMVPARPDVGDAVAACLDDPDAEVRRLACELLGRAQAVVAVPALFGLLDDPDPRVVQAASAAIQALGHDRTEALALEASRSPSSKVRRAGLRLLGYFGWASGLDALTEAVRSGDDVLRDTALQSLAYLDDARALAALLDVAGGAAPTGRAAAMRALGHTRAAPEVVGQLTAGLADPDAWVRYYACQSIGRLKAPGPIDALVERLADPAGQVRIAVIDALARIRDPRAAAALLEATTAAAADLRSAALLGLGIACPPEGLAPILAAAADPDPTLRAVALSALSLYTGERVEATLAAAARDPDEAVRTAAITVLAGRSGILATEGLIGMLGDPELHDRAIDALARWVPGRIPAILQALEQPERDDATALTAALARMRRADARAALGVALALAPPASRRAAVTALAAIGAGTSLLQIQHAAASDPDPEVRRLSQHALVRP